jgi:2-aminomuconate deaminase
MSTTAHDSNRAPEPVGAYPHARRVGNLLFLSGVGPRKRGTTEIPGVTLAPDGSIAAADIEAQAISVFENIKAILEDAGSSWDNIVDVLVFLTHMERDFKVYNRVYAEWFAGEGKPNPTRTTIEINCLPTPIAIELKVVATID